MFLRKPALAAPCGRVGVDPVAPETVLADRSNLIEIRWLRQTCPCMQITPFQHLPSFSCQQAKNCSVARFWRRESARCAARLTTSVFGQGEAKNANPQKRMWYRPQQRKVRWNPALVCHAADE